MTAKSNLKNLIQSSSLKASEKDLWYGFIDKTDNQELKIIIDPHGETLGSVSVDLVKT